MMNDCLSLTPPDVALNSILQACSACKFTLSYHPRYGSVIVFRAKGKGKVLDRIPPLVWRDYGLGDGQSFRVPFIT